MENNVLIQGIEDQAWEDSVVTCKKTLTAISLIANGTTPKECLDVVQKIPIKNIVCVGEYNSCRAKPVQIEFSKKSSTDFLLQQRKNLPSGIYVDKEYNAEVERERHILQPILCKAKTLQEYKFKSEMEENHLIIKGKTYTIQTMHTLPANLSGYHVSSKDNPATNTLGFFGELSPFLNFHLANFQLGSLAFHSSEQFIQYQKATLFLDDAAKDKILNSKSALECKQIAREIENLDIKSWKEKAEELCEPGIYAKFLQNPGLSKILTETGSRTLVECSYDKLWGCVKLLRDVNCLNETEWSGDNILGKILRRLCGKVAGSTSNGDNNVSAMQT